LARHLIGICSKLIPQLAAMLLDLFGLLFVALIGDATSSRAT
jgi:hypothetical protein